MPQIKLSHIVSFSSEDSNYPASNLLSSDIVNKRWLGQSGETSNSVVLQLEKCVQISEVHIGNHHSAFVEVLVGRSESNNHNFEVLICANSFMNPSDSRNSENISRVKTFSGDQLASDVKTKKWDRVRIVCTQPYNKHVQFGLSFVQIFTSDGESSFTPKLSVPSSETTQLGRFKLRKSSSDDEDVGSSFKPGELFARQKQGSLSIDAEIRKAGKPDSISSNNKDTSLFVKAARPNKPQNDSSSKKTDGEETLSRKRDALMYDEDDDKKHDKIDRIMRRDREEKQKASESTSTPSRDKKTHSTDLFKNSPKAEKNNDKFAKQNSKDDSRSKDESRSKDLKRPSPDDSGGPSAKKVRDIKPKKDAVMSEVEDIPRGPQCLKGVVFVLSGYVNPKRSILRTTAMSLGAKYAPDWAPHCTHLICAFPNTPKHEQVKKSSPGAVIVNGEWIEECGTEEAHLPWNWYALDPQQRTTRPDGPLPKPQTKADLPGSSRNVQPEISESENDTDDEIEKVMKLHEEKEAQKKTNNIAESGSDTDIDEQMVTKVNQKDDTTPRKLDDPYSVDTPRKKHGIDDTYNASTQPQDKKTKSPTTDSGVDEALPDLFQFMKFYVDPNLEDTKYDVAEIRRYIIAYGGELSDKWPNNKADVVITHEKFLPRIRFDGDKRCMYLRPEWIWKCNDTETLYAFEQFSVL